MSRNPLLIKFNRNLAHERTDAGEQILESFQVSTITGKLPPSFKDYQDFKA